MFFILGQQKLRIKKPKNKLGQLHTYYSELKQKGLWIVCLAIFVTGGQYFLQKKAKSVYSTELAFLVNYEEILLFSDIKKRKRFATRNRRVTRGRKRQVLELINSALKTPEFQTKVLFKKAIIKGKKDFLANHVIHYQQLLQQLQNLQKEDLVGFEFTHGNVDSFTIQEQRAFKILTRQLPRRLQPIQNKIKNDNQFIEELQHKLVESNVANVNNLRRGRFGLPNSFSFRARSINPELPAIILITVYEQLNKYFEEYHHQLIYTPKEQLKLELERFENDFFELEEKIIKVEERMNNVSSRITKLPLNRLKEERKFLNRRNINRNGNNLLRQLELMVPPKSPFILLQYPEFQIPPTSTYQITLTKAFYTFSLVLVFGMIFLMIRAYVTSVLWKIWTIWVEGEKEYQQKKSKQ